MGAPINSYPPMMMNPPRRMAVVTKSDSTVLEETTHLWVGVSGDVAITASNGTTVVTLKNAQAGIWLPLRCTKVMSAGTSATDMVAGWAD